MRFTVLTLFPDMIAGFVRESIIARAALAGLISVDVRNIRDYALDKHSVVDDYPYGGGAGMVMKADVALRAIESVEAGCGLIEENQVGPVQQRLGQADALQHALREFAQLFRGVRRQADQVEQLVDALQGCRVGDVVQVGVQGQELPTGKPIVEAEVLG